MIWEETRSEILNGCEYVASDWFFQGDFWLDTDKGMWEGFWSEITNGTLASSGGACWGNLVVEPSRFAIAVVTPFVNVTT